MFKSYVKERMRGTKLFKWEPDIDIIVAFATLFIMWASCYGVMEIKWYYDSLISQIFLFVLLTTTFMAVIFPIWWIKSCRKQSLSELGITKKYLFASLIISLGIAIWRGFDLIPYINELGWAFLLPTFISSALIFWEPFFVFGWLQTRYEKVLGIIPAIFLAAASFLMYQVGSVTPEGLINLFPVYLVLASSFALTKNIFTIWPIYWCVGSSINQLSLGMSSDLGVAAVYVIALIIQFGSIFYFRNSPTSRRKKHQS